MHTKLSLALLACSLLATPVALAAGKLSGQDAKFFREIGEANLAEVQAGKLGQQKASSEEVKKFAQHMVDDHGKMVDEQQSMAKSKGVEAPKQPGKDQQAAMKKLQAAKGESFDTAFVADGQGSRQSAEAGEGHRGESQGRGPQGDGGKSGARNREALADGEAALRPGFRRRHRAVQEAEVSVLR
jgi:predicted outer membrane protein